MKTIKNTKANNRTYLIKNNNKNIQVTLSAALPHAKKAKYMTIETANGKLNLTGRQINVIKNVLEKSKVITG
jgi:hypothetical protein